MTSTYQRELYRVERLPVFQNRMYESSQAARDCPKGDVVLVQDLRTGLIHNDSFRPDLMVYDQFYQNEQALSSIFQRHLNDVVELIGPHFRGLQLVEIGCGKGHFLEQLHGQGFQIIGLDPTYEGTNPAILKEYFNADSGVEGEAIILRHVLEHIQDPVGFLMSIKEANHGRGLIYIEVPCFDWICEHRTWFDVFYEHVNYFRLDDFQRIFGDVKELRRTFGGQYLSVVANLESLKIPDIGTADQFAFPSNFLESVDIFCQRFKAAPSSTRNLVQPQLTVWGGASKGVIFSLFMERAGIQVNCVIDINPGKQDKFLAATGIQVLSPEMAFQQLPTGSDIVVMNNNYLAEIEQTTAGRFNCITVECSAKKTKFESSR